MTNSKVLVVEDSVALAETYRAYLSRVIPDVTVVHGGREALAALRASSFDCVVLDVNLPDMTGLDIMADMKKSAISAEVVIITANGSINLAVDVMRLGAFDFIVKPFNAERLRITVRNALEKRALAMAATPGRRVAGELPPGNFVGSSAPMQDVYRVLRSAAPTNATVFVTGETGSGKELCAEALHLLSKRAKAPFVTLNCAAIPVDLLESEIFGHAKGAFTGATTERNGAALQADGGTLFLDEICEMELPLQAKLLRFLQTRQVQRLGEDRLRPADVRIVCATNRDPVAEMNAGRFRVDLFYRLHVVPLAVPPLRDRGDDVMAIAEKFLASAAREDGKGFKRFSASARDALLACAWPGNVRQLQNVVRNIVALNDGEEITESMLPASLLGDLRGAPPPREAAVNGTPAELLRLVSDANTASGRNGPIRPLEEVIRATIEDAIARCDGSIPRAAAALCVSPSTLYRRLEGWKIDEPGVAA